MILHIRTPTVEIRFQCSVYFIAISITDILHVKIYVFCDYMCSNKMLHLSNLYHFFVDARKHNIPYIIHIIQKLDLLFWPKSMKIFFKKFIKKFWTWKFNKKKKKQKMERNDIIPYLNNTRAKKANKVSVLYYIPYIRTVHGEILQALTTKFFKGFCIMLLPLT